MAMIRRCAIAGGLLAILMSPTEAIAQEAPSPITACQDQVRVLRVLVEQYAGSEQRQRIDAAQAIAELTKQLERARAELESAKKAPK